MSFDILLLIDMDNKIYKENNKICELLSPAGNYDCFLSALSAGCDAVYLAGEKFGARASADNFDELHLLKALDLAHFNNKKIYMTVNTLLKNDELDSLCDYLKPYYEAGLDGIIVQDFGVASVVNKAFPNLSIHGSTQMAVTDTPGVLAAIKLGISRIVLARELSLAEINRIYKDTGIEIECFIHGALCYSYSGKCLLSSFIGQRSGNRGRCAQPCRLEYNGKNLISMKDLCTLQILDKLVDSGICSFKIEGRLKNPDYVYTVTSVYRKYLDIIAEESSNYHVDNDDLDLLLSSYTRSGNCNGYYYKRNGHDMITISFPGYSSQKESAVLDFKNIENSLKQPVNIKVSAHIGRHLEMDADFKGISYHVSSQNIIEKAQKRAITEEDIIKQISKTGDTLFVIGSAKIDMDDDIFIPVSLINETRRALFEGLGEAYRNDLSDTRHINEIKVVSASNVPRNNTKTKYEINAQSDNYDVLNYLCGNDSVTGIVVSIENKSVLSIGKNIINAGKKLYLKMPYILRSTSGFMDYSAMHDIILELCPYGIYISNLEALEIFRKFNYDGEIIADIHVYNLNNEAHDFLINLGCYTTTVPVELNEKELLSRRIINEDLIVYGKLPMMISAQCVRTTMSQKCEKSKHANDYLYIKDRLGNNIPVYNNCNNCTNVLYNSVPVSLHGKMDLINKLSPSSIRFCFTDEDVSEVDSIISGFFDKNYNPKGQYTRGHLNRGIL